MRPEDARKTPSFQAGSVSGRPRRGRESDCLGSWVGAPAGATRQRPDAGFAGREVGERFISENGQFRSPGPVLSPCSPSISHGH